MGRKWETERLHVYICYGQRQEIVYITHHLVIVNYNHSPSAPLILASHCSQFLLILGKVLFHGVTMNFLHLLDNADNA
jgi:hypothetical protein